jgi:hypothetical protein
MKKSYKTWSKGKNAGQPKTQTDSVVQYLVDKLGSTELPSTNGYIYVIIYGKYISKNLMVRVLIKRGQNNE